MGKFSGLLICSDFDGTVACSGKVSPRNAEAIRYFQENGGLFTLATGRTAQLFCEESGDFSCNTHLILMNGSMLYDGENQRVLYECPMQPSYQEVLAKILQEFDGIGDVVFFPRAQMGSVPIPSTDVNALAEMARQEMYKLVFHVKTEQSGAIKARMEELAGSDFFVSRSWANGVELQSSACDKGKTARRLANLVGADQLIGVGDYENDLPLIREADVGYAMGNAVDALKEAADVILDTVKNDGFAQMVEGL